MMNIATPTPSDGLSNDPISPPSARSICRWVRATARFSVLAVVLVTLALAGGMQPAAAQQLDRVEADVLQQARADFHGDDLNGKDGPMGRLSLELSLLYQEHQQFQQSGADSFEPASIPTPKTPSASLGKSGPSDAPNPTGYISPVRGESVVIDAIPRESVADLKATMQQLGAENIASYANLVSAVVPIERLPDLAAASSLRSAAMAHAAIKSASVSRRLVDWLERKAAGNAAGPMPAARSSASGSMPLPGVVVSEGDEAMNTDDVRANLNIDGSGIKIGALSDSYNTADAATTAEDDIASGDLPPAYRIDVLQDLADGSDEGRAMMQILHDVAPGADLAFHTAFGGRANFAQGILDLVDAGSDVTVDDVGYFNEPFFQDGPIAQAVDAAAAAGVPHFASAGNEADQSVESDTWSTVSGPQGPAFDFGGTIGGGTTDTTQAVLIGASSQFGTARFIFQWDDPAATADTDPGNTSTPQGADTDLDLLLYNSDGDLVASSTDDNIGGDPVEILQFSSPTTTTYQLVIRQVSGPDPGLIKYTHNGALAPQEYDTNSSSSVGHNNAAGGAGVAAAFYQNTPAFGTDPALPEDFTSLGGTPIFFETDGTLRPDPGPRDQPRITAPDGTDNTFFGSDRDGDGLPNFSGTSAAAPHAAALAALQLQADPGLTPTQVYDAQASGAEDMESAGFDFLTGAGLVNAQNTITGTTGPQDIELVTASTIPFGQRFFDSSSGSLFEPAAATIEIVNAGNQDLEITSVSISGGAFRFQSGSAISTGTLGPTERVTATLLFEPSSAGSFAEAVTIDSDDPDAAESTVTIDVSGEAILPPVADVSTGSLFEAVETGNTATQSIEIANTGDNPLEVDVFAEALGLGPFDPGEVARPPATNATKRRTAAASDVQALDAPNVATDQVFDVSQFIYTLDDGTPENSLGVGSPVDLFALNAFEAQDGATTITALASAFGGSQPIGSEVEFLLYEDPNDDGNPEDANLLQTVSTTTDVSGGGNLQIEPIPPTPVEGVFFIAILVPDTPNFPLAIDQSSDQGASWIANADPNAFDTANLGSGRPPSQSSLDRTADIGFAGNWLLRAQGAYVAFEPVSGTVDAGNSNAVDITFDGSSLATGRYTANAAVTSNDPATPRIDLPVTFFVADAVAEAELGSSGSNEIDVVFGNTGFEANLTDASGSGTVTAMRFDDAPANVSGLAAGESPSSYRWFIRQDGDLTFDASSELRFLRSGIPQPGFDASNAETITVYRRSDFGTGTFNALTTSFDDGTTAGDLSDDALTATGATSLSEFVFASDTAPLPVEVASFDAVRDGPSVVLSWTTTSETNNAGFQVERRPTNAETWTDTGVFVEGSGTTSEQQTYRVRLDNLEPNTYTFRLRSVDVDGTETVGPTAEVEVPLEQAYKMSPVRPNPITNRGRIDVQVREQQPVTVTLYNILGQQVRTVHDGVLTANTRHTMTVNASSLASGIYFLRVDGESFQTTRKITLAQ